MDSLIKILVEKLAGRLLTKWLTSAAVAMAVHGIMRPESQDAWVSANVEALLGALVWLATHYLTVWQHKTIAQADPQPPKGNQGNFPGGVGLIAALLLIPAAGFAQAPAQPGVGDVIWQAGKEALVYVQEHGEVGAGYFVILDRGQVVGKGPGTAQSVYPVEFTPGGAVQVRLGVAHASVPAPEKSWELAMATASVKLLDLTPAERLSDAPIVAKALRLRWGGLRGGLFVGTPVDELLLAAGAQIQWEFGK